MRSPCLLLLTLAACGRIDFASTSDARGDVFTMRDVGPNATYSEVVLASGPRMYYRLGETGGSSAADASGNGYTATYAVTAGTITYARPGALTRETDTAVRIDGDGNTGPNSGAAVLLDPSNMSWAGDFTIEMFYVPNAIAVGGATQDMFLCERYTINGFRVGWNDTQQLHLWTTEAGATGDLSTAGGAFDMTSLRHVAVTRQGQTFTIYVDAIAVGSGLVDYIPATSVADCGFGSFHGMPAFGTFDEVAIYDRALSQTEVASHVAAR